MIGSFNRCFFFPEGEDEDEDEEESDEVTSESGEFFFDFDAAVVLGV